MPVTRTTSRPTLTAGRQYTPLSATTRISLPDVDNITVMPADADTQLRSPRKPRQFIEHKPLRRHARARRAGGRYFDNADVADPILRLAILESDWTPARASPVPPHTRLPTGLAAGHLTTYPARKSTLPSPLCATATPHLLPPPPTFMHPYPTPTTHHFSTYHPSLPHTPPALLCLTGLGPSAAWRICTGCLHSV